MLTARQDRVALFAGLAVFLAHAMLAGRYDFFRDELYFIVVGQHPAFGYVDQPPLVPLLAAGLHKLGLGVAPLRLPVAAASGGLVWLAVRFARMLGGGTLALAMAGSAAALAPMLMGLSAVLNTTAFDPLIWTAIAFLLVRAIRQEDDRALILAGLIAGVGLQVKYALLFWIAGMVIGLLATPQRAVLGRRALWIAALAGGLIAAPSFVWQALNGFPFLELGAAARDKNVNVGLAPFLLNQVMVMNPAFAPLWLAGLVAPFVSARLRDLRFVPIACAVVFAIVRLGHGKDYYLAACYPVLFVIGAVALAPLCTGTARKLLAGMFGVAGLTASAFAAPLALPVLSPAQLEQWIERTGFAPQQQERNFSGTVLPQVFADQLGWRDFASQVAMAWSKVPAGDRAATAIMVENYGEAAALDIYAGPRGLPPALSGHNQYFLWGLRGQHPTNLLVVHHALAEVRPFCAGVEVLGQTYSPRTMGYENGKAIALCRGLRQPLASLWPRVKSFR